MARDQPRQLLATLLALRKHGQPHEVILVDNASMSEVRGLVDISQLPITVVRLPEHTSLSGAFNVGLDAASNDLVLLLHGDVLVDADPAAGFTTLNRDESIGVAGAKLFQDAPPPRRLLHAGYRVGLGLNWSAPIGRMDWDTFQRPRVAGAVSDACMFVRRTGLRFDERYWFQLQDIDFCLQYRASGYRVMLLASVQAIHLEQGGLREQRVSPKWAAREIATRWLHHRRWTDRPEAISKTFERAVRGDRASQYLRRVDQDFDDLQIENSRPVESSGVSLVDPNQGLV